MEYEVIFSNTKEGLVSNADQLLELVQSCDYKKYNYVVTANNYDDAKKDRKKLEDTIKAAKRKRIDFEKKMLSEWNPVKDKLMKAEKIIEVYSNALKDGINEYDAKEKAEKKDLIEQFFFKNRGDLEIPFEVVFESDFLAKSYSNKKWQEAIIRKINDYELDYKLLAKYNVADPALLQSFFLQTWDRLSAIDKYNEHEESVKKADEIKSEKKEAEPDLEGLILDEIPQSNDILKQIDHKTVREMVSICGNENLYKKVKSYALTLGLTWEEL